MTRTQIIEKAKELNLPFIRELSGAIPIDAWKPKHADAYDGFRIVGGEMVVDQPTGSTESRFGGAWPLLSRAPSSEAKKA